MSSLLLRAACAARECRYSLVPRSCRESMALGDLGGAAGCVEAVVQRATVVPHRQRPVKECEVLAVEMARSPQPPHLLEGLRLRSYDHRAACFHVQALDKARLEGVLLQVRIAVPQGIPEPGLDGGLPGHLHRRCHGPVWRLVDCQHAVLVRYDVRHLRFAGPALYLTFVGHLLFRDHNHLLHAILVLLPCLVLLLCLPLGVAWHHC
mmetsp:Transcript_146131/g.407127  ORF Transcript_146131/g.407127 Transcript_146131/m.407127 type:complete len:207 (+) Transcript_146131:1503-2123(+)